MTSVFIIDVQTQIRPDYNQMSFTILTILLNTTSGTPNNSKPPAATEPGPAAVGDQAVLYSALASSLLAAFFAMLGKQWLNLHVDG